MPHPNEHPKGLGDADPPHDAVTPPASGGLASAAPAASGAAAPELEPDALPAPAPELVPEPPEELVPELVPTSEPEPEPPLEPELEAPEPASGGPPLEGFELHATRSSGAAAPSKEKCSLVIFALPAGATVEGRLQSIPLQSRFRRPRRLAVSR